jgi:DNA-directed RNA polymerase specialized sigma24 family protein
MSRDAAFSPTRWSLIAALRSGDEPARGAALDALCTAYWYPLYAYARRSGQGPDDAADLTQSFFAHLLEKEVFAMADPERGRLRTFLLSAMQRFLRDDWRKQQRLKRGSGVVPLSIDEALAEQNYAHEPADKLTPEALYHRRWALTLIERTVLELRTTYAAQGKVALFDALSPTLTEDPDAATAVQLGAQLTMAPGAVRVAISRLRRRYRERLLAEVAGSLDAQSETEVEEEIAALFRALS